MKNLILVISLIVFVEMNSFSQPSPAVVVDWKITEAELGRVFEDSIDDPFRQSDVFKTLQATHNQQLFLEMTAQVEHPFVALAGFLCLKEQFPRQTVGPAMQLILGAKRPGSPLCAAVYQFLGDQKDSAEMNAALTEIASVGQYYRLSNYHLLVLALSYETLFSWYHAQQRPVLCATSEAVVLDRLCGEAKERGKAISPMMAAALDRMKLVPGIPRITFILYGTADDAVITTNLKWVLEAGSIDDSTAIVLIANKREFVEKLLATHVQMSDETRTQMEKLLKGKLGRAKTK